MRKTGNIRDIDSITVSAATGEKVYHVNPETNRPNICRSEPGKCSVATKAKHYETLEEAKEKIAQQKNKSAAKKSVKPKEKPAPAEPQDTEVASVEEPKKDIIQVLIEDSLRDKTEEELAPKRQENIFSTISEGTSDLAKKAEELKDSVITRAKNPKLAETTEKFKNVAVESFGKLESFGKSSLGKLKDRFAKRKA